MPRLRGVLTTLIRASPAALRATTCNVPSVEQSFTTTTCRSRSVCDWMLCSACSTYGRRLYTGRRTLISAMRGLGESGFACGFATAPAGACDAAQQAEGDVEVRHGGQHQREAVDDDGDKQEIARGL